LHGSGKKDVSSEKLEYQKVTDLITQAREIENRRDALAERMKKLQALRDDNVVLSLLKGVTESLSDSDCLNFLQIDGHTREQSQGRDTGPVYLVRLQGITSNDSTHSKFLERLTEIGKKTNPPIEVPLGEKQLRQMMETEVTFFDITCGPPTAKAR
jgi:hypothetical protein